MVPNGKTRSVTAGAGNIAAGLPYPAGSRFKELFWGERGASAWRGEMNIITGATYHAKDLSADQTKTGDISRAWFLSLIYPASTGRRK
jgi:hypothetical protein